MQKEEFKLTQYYTAIIKIEADDQELIYAVADSIEDGINDMFNENEDSSVSVELTQWRENINETN